MRCLLLGVVAVIGCRGRAPAAQRTPAAATADDVVPRVTAPINADGELSEPDWPQRSMRGQFHGDDGALARPSSELRLLHDDHDLFVALYAADENIETRDAFDVTIGKLSVRVDSFGKVEPQLSGVRAAVDFDEGTRNDPKDDDEEWVVELVVPLALTGLGPSVHQPVHIARCDVTKDAVERCGSWSASLTIE